MNCDYCQGPLSFKRSSAFIYGKDYGPIYICPPCQAWVGCHPGTTDPLGRVANKRLRGLKVQTHRAFDPFWKNSKRSRKDAYAMLARALGITTDDCHIGMFDEETCKEVIQLCALSRNKQGPDLKGRAPAGSKENRRAQSPTKGEDEKMVAPNLKGGKSYV